MHGGTVAIKITWIRVKGIVNLQNDVNIAVYRCKTWVCMIWSSRPNEAKIWLQSRKTSSNFSQYLKYIKCIKMAKCAVFCFCFLLLNSPLTRGILFLYFFFSFSFSCFVLFCFVFFFWAVDRFLTGWDARNFYSDVAHKYSKLLNVRIDFALSGDGMGWLWVSFLRIFTFMRTFIALVYC